MCEYCEGKTPLLYIEHDDNTGVNDPVSIKIEYFGTRPFIISEYKKSKPSITSCNVSSDRKKQCSVMRWGCTINYCPMCGKKLI